MTSVVRFVKPQAMRLVVADDDARHAREAEARRRRTGSRAVTVRHFRPDLMPDARQRGAEVRVVRQQRHPALGEIARDDPGVRADALAGVADERARPPRSTPSTSSHSIDAVATMPRRRASRARRSRGGHGRDRRDDHRDCGRTGTPGTAGRSASDVKSGAIERALGLVLDVGAEVPGHRLQPRHRVGGRPRLDLVVGVLQPEHRVLERRVGAVVVGEVGVHARRRRRRSTTRPSGRAPRPPARRPRASRGCAGTCRSRSCDSPNSSETRPARDVPAEVHLPEPVLRVDVPLREEEVVGVAGRDRRDAEHIALHRRRRRRDPRPRRCPRAAGTSAGSCTRRTRPRRARSR